MLGLPPEVLWKDVPIVYLATTSIMSEDCGATNPRLRQLQHTVLWETVVLAPTQSSDGWLDRAFCRI